MPTGFGLFRHWAPRTCWRGRRRRYILYKETSGSPLNCRSKLPGWDMWGMRFHKARVSFDILIRL